jgi:hypothetical protein
MSYLCWRPFEDVQDMIHRFESVCWVASPQRDAQEGGF